MIKELYKQYPIVFFGVIAATVIALILIASPSLLQLKPDRTTSAYKLTGPNIRGYGYGKWEPVKTVLIGDGNNNLILEFNVSKCRRKTIITTATLKYQKAKVGKFYKYIPVFGLATFNAGAQCANSKNQLVTTAELTAEFSSLSPDGLKFEFLDKNGKDVHP